MAEGRRAVDGYDLYFGPVHPGSGNFGVKLTVDGEWVVAARADPGYLHRGFEKLMEYRTPMQNAVLSDRLCILESLNWNLVHAEAVDRLCGTEIPERARYIRVILAELSRIQSHIIWYGVLSKALGFDTGFMVAFGYRDYVLDLFEFVTGGRVYPAGYICPGGVRRDVPEGTKKRIEELLVKMETMLREFEAYDSKTIAARCRGIGVLELDDALRLGATGPVLRASGLASDATRRTRSTTTSTSRSRFGRRATRSPGRSSDDGRSRSRSRSSGRRSIGCRRSRSLRSSRRPRGRSRRARSTCATRSPEGRRPST